MPVEKLNKNLSNDPGVYLFKNSSGDILYVGKAKNLKKRVSSYFAKKIVDRPWIEIMMPSVESVETIIVHTEVEALLLEAELIRQHTPRFNIKLTDDKSYPFIKLVSTEAYPRFVITRVRGDKKAKYFGPYFSAKVANYTLEFLQKLYGIHVSQQPIRATHDRACLNCQMYGFTCPLHNEIEIEKYQERIDKAVMFLEGKRKNLLDDLEDRMQVASNEQNFELAAKLRDRLHGIQQTMISQQIISNSLDDYDAIAAATSNKHACVTLMPVREGRVAGGKHFYFETNDGQTSSEIIRQFLISIYPNFSPITKQIVLNEKIEDIQSIIDLLQQLDNTKVDFFVAQRGDKKHIVNLAMQNAQTALETKLLKLDQAYNGLIALKELLNLPNIPELIEAVDISNLGASEPIGAIVCFTNGQPDKNEYRRFNIKTVQGQNDFAMIKEIVSRRFSDVSRNVPDIFVVDGGIEQLRFAFEALQTTPVKPKMLISLAKKPDRVFLPGKNLPLRIGRGNKGVLLLARIRDEVHRFGISFHRQKQQKKSLKTSD